jgi:hypothetical protein
MHQLNSTKRARVTSNAIHLPSSRILHYLRFRYPINTNGYPNKNKNNNNNNINNNNNKVKSKPLELRSRVKGANKWPTIGLGNY